MTQLRIPQEQIRAHIQDHQRQSRSVIKQLEKINSSQRAKVLEHVESTDTELVSVGLLSRQTLSCILGDVDVAIILWIVTVPSHRFIPCVAPRDNARLRDSGGHRPFLQPTQSRPLLIGHHLSSDPSSPGDYNLWDKDLAAMDHKGYTTPTNNQKIDLAINLCMAVSKNSQPRTY